MFRYLASSDSMISVSYAFRLGKSTVSEIILETCTAIWESLHEKVLRAPNEEDWKRIADGFLHKWNFPNCAGAIDGKHVVIQVCPNIYNYLFLFYIHIFI